MLFNNRFFFNLLTLIIGLSFYIFLNFFDFTFLDSKFQDAYQNIFTKIPQTNQVKTVTIDSAFINKFGRPLNYRAIADITNNLLKYNPTEIIFLISPKELTENETELHAIRNLWEHNKVIYLFSPYTNGPLGGFHAHKIFESFPRHFEMQYSKDITIGPRDGKSRRLAIYYYNETRLDTTLLQLKNDFNLPIKPIDFFKYSFDLWDTKQVFIYNQPLGAFGQYSLNKIVDDPSQFKNELSNKIILVGSLHEFSVHLTPSIFSLFGIDDTKLVSKAFFPANELAANIISTLITGEYILKSPLWIEHAIGILILTMTIFAFSGASLNRTFRLTFFMLLITLILGFIVFGFTHIVLSFSKPLVGIIILQYFGLPIKLIPYVREQERKKQKEILESKIQTAISTAKQVSHDIRSPLTALNMMLGQMHQLPEQQRVIMRGAITRINDIANDLLTKDKKIQDEQNTSKSENFEQAQLTTQLLSPIIEIIVSEKRIQFREKQNIEIVLNIDQSYGVFANINSTEFKRTISNLLNNAIEAMPESKGHIIVTIIGETDFVRFTIQDDGKGIPQHIINKLGQKGVSHGKEGTQSGSGLGIYHAKKTVESFDGRFEIDSHEGIGTTISMLFPRAPAPKWFVEKLSLRLNHQIISIDDDLSIHAIFRDRFESKHLYEIGIKHLTFTSGDEFKNWFLNNPTINSSRLYLVDFELLNQKYTGLEIIEQLGIASQAILVTSRYEEGHIRAKCDQLGIRLIPKAMAGLVPIEIEKSKKYYDACLIDDDFLVEVTWKMAAEIKTKSMIYFAEPESFFKKAPEIDFEVPIYIDSNLGNSIIGEDISKKIFDMGFKNIWLCTGYEASRFPPMNWLKGIIPKDPVF